MKLWEVIKELTEDPTKKFELDSDDRIYTLSAVRGAFSTFFCLSAINGEGENITNLGSGKTALFNLIADEENWQLVRQPVTWQKAIEEFAKGKKLIVMFNNQEWSLGELVELPMYLNRAITNGEWYVED